MIAICPPASVNLSEYISFLESNKFAYKFIKNIKDVTNDISIILLCGGGNISNTKRDILEFEILKTFYNKIPFIGICRGLEICTLFNGGELSKIENNNHNDINNISSFHKIILNNIEMIANSRHTMKVSKVPTDFEIISTSAEDNIIEILKHNKNLFVQFHPERHDMDGTLLKYLFINYIQKYIYNKNIFEDLESYNLNKILNYFYINDFKIVSFRSLKKNMCLTEDDILYTIKNNPNKIKKTKNKKDEDCVCLI